MEMFGQMAGQIVIIINYFKNCYSQPENLVLFFFRISSTVEVAEESKTDNPDVQVNLQCCIRLCSLQYTFLRQNGFLKRFI